MSKIVLVILMACMGLTGCGIGESHAIDHSDNKQSIEEKVEGIDIYGDKKMENLRKIVYKSDVKNASIKDIMTRNGHNFDKVLDEYIDKYIFQTEEYKQKKIKIKDIIDKAADESNKYFNTRNEELNKAKKQTQDKPIQGSEQAQRQKEVQEIEKQAIDNPQVVAETPVQQPQQQEEVVIVEEQYTDEGNQGVAPSTGNMFDDDVALKENIMNAFASNCQEKWNAIFFADKIKANKAVDMLIANDIKTNDVYINRRPQGLLHFLINDGINIVVNYYNQL